MKKAQAESANDKDKDKEQGKDQPKKEVEVYYVCLGTLLSKNGESIMEKLTDNKYLQLMNIPIIKYLVMFQYRKVENEIQKRLLYPFFALLILFSIYSVYFVTYSDDDPLPVQGPTNMDAIWFGFKKFFNWTNIFLLLATLAYFLYVEAKQFFLEPTEYFSEFWNIADLLNYVLCLCVILFDVFSISYDILRPVSTLCFIVLWIKMFYFLRVFKSTS